jgi:hypothetical protein
MHRSHTQSHLGRLRSAVRATLRPKPVPTSEHPLSNRPVPVEVTTDMDEASADGGGVGSGGTGNGSSSNQRTEGSGDAAEAAVATAAAAARRTPAIETEHVRAVYDTIATHW